MILRRAALGSITALLFVAPLAQAAEQPVWADRTSPQTKAACRIATQRPLPPVDAGGPAPAHCDLVALYDGIGGKPDYRGALACALHGERGGDKGPFDPDAILSMLYANGYGVARDDDLAIAYACQMGGAIAEMDGRIDHLLARKKEGAKAKPFDVCDDITSGYMQGFCASRGERAASAARDAELAGLVGRLAPAARAAFGRLKRVHEAYVKAITDHEVDLSGTARAMFEIDAEAKEKANFVAALRKILPPAKLQGGPKDDAKADARLNARYKSVQAINESDLGTVTHAGIKTTERAWLAYRDAFLAFAATAAPSTSRDALAALLTEQRIAKLGDFLGKNQP